MMAHERDRHEPGLDQDWRPDVNVPRDYPPPPRPATLWEPAQADQRVNEGIADPRYQPTLHEQTTIAALHRCLADVEAAAQRLRAMIARLG
jgi:hypothetical protein